MVALVAISVGATFAITYSGALQSSIYQAPSPTSGTYMTGHVEAVVRNNEGFITAYRQADNAIVNVGLETLADQLFLPYTFNGKPLVAGQNNHTNSTGGRFGYMNIGNLSVPAPDALDTGLKCPLLDAGARACSVGASDRPLCVGIASEIWNTKAVKRLVGVPTNVAQINVTAIATFDGLNCFSNAIQEAALWNNGTNPAVAPKGQMFARNTFGSVTLTTTDSLQLTWRFTFTDQ